MKKRAAYFLLAGLVLAGFMPGEALASCTTVPVANASGVAFGNYDAVNGVTISGTVTVNCALNLGTLPDFTVSLSTGQSNSFTQRQMNFLTAKVNYNLYTSSAGTTVWGDGTGATAKMSYSSSGGLTTKPFTVWGIMPKSQFPAPGVYGDTINVTVTY